MLGSVQALFLLSRHFSFCSSTFPFVWALFSLSISGTSPFSVCPGTFFSVHFRHFPFLHLCRHSPFSVYVATFFSVHFRHFPFLRLCSHIFLRPFVIFLQKSLHISFFCTTFAPKIRVRLIPTVARQCPDGRPTAE